MPENCIRIWKPITKGSGGGCKLPISSLRITEPIRRIARLILAHYDVESIMRTKSGNFLYHLTLNGLHCVRRNSAKNSPFSRSCTLAIPRVSQLLMLTHLDTNAKAPNLCMATSSKKQKKPSTEKDLNTFVCSCMLGIVH